MRPVVDMPICCWRCENLPAGQHTPNPQRCLSHIYAYYFSVYYLFASKLLCNQFSMLCTSLAAHYSDEKTSISFMCHRSTALSLPPPSFRYTRVSALRSSKPKNTDTHTNYHNIYSLCGEVMCVWRAPALINSEGEKTHIYSDLHTASHPYTSPQSRRSVYFCSNFMYRY